MREIDDVLERHVRDPDVGCFTCRTYHWPCETARMALALQAAVLRWERLNDWAQQYETEFEETGVESEVDAVLDSVAYDAQQALVAITKQLEENE